MVFVTSYISGIRRTWCINENVTTSGILEALQQREGSVKDVVLQCNSQILTSESSVASNATVVATLRLPGGKGGFGSMLRAIGAQIEKTTNREACRDLSGRRLRDINEEKRLKDFISKKAEREREMQERKCQKFEKLKETPKHIFQDESYYQQREKREKNLFDSLDKALKNGNTSGVKRSCEGEAVPIKRMRTNKLLVDLDDSSDESEDECSGSSDKKSSSESEDNAAESKNENHISPNNVSKPSTNGAQDSIKGKETGSDDSEDSAPKENQCATKVGDSG
ncbi:splicing regulator SDE2-like [Macrobrachium nipponense]|uniref:splicing regulator SDE2-like n=1 Tax=Macrobrachium nipponense TaxID=159736 RepID=UPI0030C7F473